MFPGDQHDMFIALSNIGIGFSDGAANYLHQREQKGACVVRLRSPARLVHHGCRVEARF